MALLAAGLLGWLQLYKLQDTGQLTYKMAEFLRLPVAKIDDQKVLYSDYLMQYRSSIRVVERQEGKIGNTEDGRRQKNYYKRVALDNAITNAYVIKLAREKNISISQARIDKVFDEHVASGDTKVTKGGFEKLINDNFGLNLREYKRLFIELPLLKQDVSVAIDANTRQLVDRLSRQINPNGSNFDAITQELVGKVAYEPSSGVVSAQNQDGGRAHEASKLAVGQASKPFLSRSGDCYYVVKLISKKDNKVEYSSIRVPLTELAKRIGQLKKDGKAKEYIKIATD
jgi:hypothetical protein